MDLATKGELQIHQYKDDLLAAIKKNRFLIILGDTGSGKTTQIPQYLLDEKDESNTRLLYKRIAVTQPRRIAVISAAQRVCSQRGVRLGGNEVGYYIRFDKCSNPDTRLIYTTDGTLLRRQISDPKAREFDVIIIDEAHERALQTDVLIGILKKLCTESRDDLKVIVMSATLSYMKFSAFLNDAPIFSIPGRQFPVEIKWLDEATLEETISTYIQLSMECIYNIHIHEEPGDILVFLTGRMEIEQAYYQLEELLKEKRKECPAVNKLLYMPIFSSMEMNLQKRVFVPAPEGYRKVILSTNIAQTSITIPGIKYIIDSGFVKQKVYDPRTFIESLVVMPISRTAAMQRAGRAGRTAPGKVYRLYSKNDYNNMDEETTPQIQRNSLTSTILTLKQIGTDNILEFPFIDLPVKDLILSATKVLYYLNALDTQGKLTDYGRIMFKFPVSPSLSRVILSAAFEYDCLDPIIDIVSLLSSEDVFFAPNFNMKDDLIAARERLKDETGDHMTLYNIMCKWRASSYSREWCKRHLINYRAVTTARKTRKQIQKIMDNVYEKYKHLKKITKTSNLSEAVIRSFCSAYYMNTARRLRKSSTYYHYLTSLSMGESSSDENDNPKNNYSYGSYQGTGLFALHLYPGSVLYNNDIEHRANYSDWLIYNDLYFFKKPMMKVASKIEFSWVKDFINIPLKKIDIEAMVGNPQPQQEVENEDKIEEHEPKPRVIPEPRKKCPNPIKKENPEREEMIKLARERYLSRKNKRKR